jgi:hypothetical protein
MMVLWDTIYEFSKTYAMLPMTPNPAPSRPLLLPVQAKNTVNVFLFPSTEKIKEKYGVFFGPAMKFVTLGNTCDYVTRKGKEEFIQRSAKGVFLFFLFFLKKKEKKEREKKKERNLGLLVDAESKSGFVPVCLSL